MAIIGHGVDLVSISRFREVLARQQDVFLKRIFSQEEIMYCNSKKDPVPHFAARFAAKEAFGKALGIGLAASRAIDEVKTVSDPSGCPQLILGSKAQEIFVSKGGVSSFLSLSHDGDSAIASVIIWGNAK